MTYCTLRFTHWLSKQSKIFNKIHTWFCQCFASPPRDRPVCDRAGQVFVK